MKKLLSLLAIFSLFCGMVPVEVFQVSATYAYTSTLNPVDPTTAPDSYVINIPDANLKAALNQIISRISPITVRTPDQNITVKDAKRVSLMYGQQGLDAKGITNLEGIQYFTNVTSLYVTNNTPNITDAPLNIRPLQALKQLKTLIISRNNLPQNLLEEVIPQLPLLENLDIARNRATDLTPLLSPLNNLRSLTLEGNKFTTLDVLTTKTGLTYLNLNANTLSNSEIQKLGVLTNLKTLLISAILPANTFSDISFLTSLTQLEDLRLNNNKAITSLEPALASKNTIKRLEIINIGLVENVLPQVAQFTNVTEIRAG